VLLHIGNTAASWTTVNPWVVTVGLFLFLALTYAIWRPRLVHRVGRRVARPVAIVALSLAVLPSVLPFDHILPATSPEAVASSTSAVHADHCHVGPGACADAPLAAGLGQFLAADPLVVTPALTLIAVLLIIPALAGVTMRPLTRPPLPAA
jgi:hypothetical protein